MRRWSSLTRLSGQEKSGRTSCHPDAHGSLDRSLLHARADSSSPLKPSTLDLSYSDLPESRASLMTPRGHSLGHQAVGGSPIQPSVRTQMWLSEQMEFRPESTWLSEQRDRMRQDAELAQVRENVLFNTLFIHSLLCLKAKCIVLGSCVLLERSRKVSLVVMISSRDIVLPSCGQTPSLPQNSLIFLLENLCLFYLHKLHIH